MHESGAMAELGTSVREDALAALMELVPSVSEAQAIAAENGAHQWFLDNRPAGASEEEAARAYHRRVADVALTLSDPGHLGDAVRAALAAGDLRYEELASADRTTLHVGEWGVLKQRLMGDRVEKQVASSLYKCRKCGARKTTFRQLQTRSGDEGSTIYVTCVVCGAKWTDAS